MITHAFSYLAPSTLTEALQLLRAHRDDAKIIAGGQSLVPLMNLGLFFPNFLIDLNKIRELAYIREDTTNLYIGAMTTHRTIERTQLITKNCPLLSEAASQIADPLVRNRGTIGGSLSHCDPAADYLPVMVALDAEFKTQSLSGSRQLKAREFFKGPMSTALENDEILTEAKLPKIDGGSAYIKLALVEGGFAIANCAGALQFNAGQTCNVARLALGGVEATPTRLDKVERLLVGKKITEHVVDKAGDLAYEMIREPLSDIHGEKAYRHEMARVLTKRTIRLALTRGVGDL